MGNKQICETTWPECGYYPVWCSLFWVIFPLTIINTHLLLFVLPPSGPSIFLTPSENAPATWSLQPQLQEVGKGLPQWRSEESTTSVPRGGLRGWRGSIETWVQDFFVLHLTSDAKSQDLGSTMFNSSPKKHARLLRGCKILILLGLYDQELGFYLHL